MQRSTLLIGLLLFVSFPCIVCSQDIPKGSAHMDERALARIVAKVLPTEYADYKRKLVGDNGPADAQAAIAVMLKARALRAKLPPVAPLQDKLPGQRPPDWEQRQNIVEAYRATWHLCLQSLENSQDEASQQLILDQWNKSLREDSECVPSQVVALGGDWDRRFLTDDFWKLLRDTKSTNSLIAMCRVLAERGNREDFDRLETIRDSLIRKKEDERAGIVAISLAYMERRLDNGAWPINESPPHFDE